jgi:hypothetical protein
MEWILVGVFIVAMLLAWVRDAGRIDDLETELADVKTEKDRWRKTAFEATRWWLAEVDRHNTSPADWLEQSLVVLGWAAKRGTGWVDEGPDDAEEEE